jgi:hypothetical protein
MPVPLFDGYVVARTPAKATDKPSPSKARHVLPYANDAIGFVLIYGGESIMRQLQIFLAAVIGQKVRYWVEGGVDESFPAQARARKIEIMNKDL